MKITHERLEQVEGYFDRHGGKTILIGRFIGLVRALAPFIAGSSGLRVPALHPLQRRRQRALVDALLRARLHLLAVLRQGRARGRPGHVRLRDDGRGDRRRRGRLPAPRRASTRGCWPASGSRCCGPCSRWPGPCSGTSSGRWFESWRPQVRFIWNRMTPGELGLELTTTLAIAGVGLYVFALYAVILSGDPGLTPFDRSSSTSRDVRSHGRSPTSPRRQRPGRAADRLRRGRGDEHRARRARGGSPRWSSGGRLRLIYAVVHVDQGRHRPAAAHRPAGRHRRLLVPERARRLLDRLGGRRR